MSRFIHVYPKALSPEFCDSCIQKFEKSPNQTKGKTGQGVDLKKKNSTDITINNFLDEWQDEVNQLNQIVLNGLMHYCRSYPYVVCGAIGLQKQNQSGEILDITADDIKTMDDSSLASIVTSIYRLGTINIQKYDKGKGGYFHWHSENFPHPHNPENESLHRVLLWMFYLNDVEEGGETEFFYQDQKIKPAKGTLVIAPSDFTHTHRGSMPVSNDKYIFTSWVLFQKAEKLYGKK